MTNPSVHRAALSRREALLFEAGIKLGGIFHQYLGVPVSPRTAPGLARTIERAVALQPYVAHVRVRIDPARGGPVGRGRYAYRYLVAEMLDVRVRLADGDVEVTARLAHRPDLRYSLMSVDTVRPPDPARRRPSAKTR
jgi:dihydroneopterin aldolase